MTIETLEQIKNSMDKVKNIDRSEFFNQYYNEAIQRINELKDLEKYKKDTKKEVL
jgi:uncharacterized protein YnzC (UPF0291/DUF896 family)